MRGGVSYMDLLHNLSYEDRDALYSVITENLELTKETQMMWV